MLRLSFAVVVVVGCSSYEPAPSVFGPGPSFFDAGGPGPKRVCGVIEGSACEGDGEIARCLCSSFEEQKGVFVCCRNGFASATTCMQARYAVDCSGKPAIPTMDAAVATD